MEARDRDVRLRRSLCAWFVSAAACCTSLEAQTEWARLVQLHARSAHAMVYDDVAQRVLRLGGTQWENVYESFDTLWADRAGHWSYVGSTPLVGARLYEQLFVADPATNPAGSVASAGTQLTLGAR